MNLTGMGPAEIALGIGLLIVFLGAIVWMMRRPSPTSSGRNAIAGWGEEFRLPDDPSLLTGTLVRIYRGKADLAQSMYARDLGLLGPRGYVPINQVYIPGSYSGGLWFLALLAILLWGLGLLILLYLLLVKPPGTLTVTYQLQRQAAPLPLMPAGVEQRFFPVGSVPLPPV